MFTKPSNLIGSVVLNTPIAASVTLSAGAKVAFAGLGTSIPLGSVQAYKKTAFSAGVKQVDTIALAGITVANSTQYTMVIQRLDDATRKTYTVFSASSGATATTIAVQFRAKINADPERIVNATGATSVVILTEISTDTKGFISVGVPSGATVTATTAHVNPSGSYTEVAIYDSAALTNGQYAKYEFDVKRGIGSNQSVAKVIAWAEESDVVGAADFAAFDAEVLAILSGSGITDAVVEPYVGIV